MAKGGAYQFYDRLFNLWLITNNHNKLERNKVVYLSRFLENFYKDRIPESVRKNLDIQSTHLNRITEQLEFVKSLKEQNRLRKEEAASTSSSYNVNTAASEINSYWLQKTLSQLSQDNLGMAGESLGKALADISSGFQSYEKEDWWRFSRIVLGFGHANWLLKIMKRNNIDTTLSPYYIAVESYTAADPEKFFNSVAVEIKETARELRNIISPR